MRDGEAGHGIEELVHDRAGISSVGEHEREFLTPVARHQVRSPRHALQGLRNALERGVASEMAVAVVELLEVRETGSGKRGQSTFPTRAAGG